MSQRIVYRGYEILPSGEGRGWAAWILYRDVPEGCLRGCASREAAVQAAERAIDRRIAALPRFARPSAACAGSHAAQQG